MIKPIYKSLQSLYNTPCFTLCNTDLDIILAYHQLSANDLFPCHQLSAKPNHRLSADSVFTDVYNSFIMGLPVVNTSPDRQYQLVCTTKYSKVKVNVLAYSVGCHFKFTLTEKGEHERGGWTLDGIHVDGTFKHCPTFYMQLYTIHGT